ncbi:hypothetical protein IP78_13610 [Brevundimonas sp. AAP58]|nr:hypothetical protein IP78_13610 [Brevundimonas sp. AAP58]
MGDRETRNPFPVHPTSQVAGGHQPWQFRQPISEPFRKNDADVVLRQGMHIGLKEPWAVQQTNHKISLPRPYSLDRQVTQLERQAGVLAFKVPQPWNQPLHGQAVVDSDRDAIAHADTTNGFAECIKTRR